MLFKCFNPLLNVVSDFDKLKSLSNGLILRTFFYWNRIKDNTFLKSLVLDFIKRKKIIVINCRKCLSCLNYKRLDWVKRAELERPNWKYLYFVTFTFDNEHLITPFLERRYFSYFCKRLKKLNFFNGPFKYFASGEYGSLSNRKHYHAVFFTNFIFHDLEFIKKTKRGNNIYVSKSLKDVWKNGFVSVAPVDSVAVFKYICKYSLKQFSNKFSDNIPSPYLGEHLIVSRNFGNFFNFDIDIKNLPTSLIKNFKNFLYRKNSLFKAHKIGFKEFFNFSNNNYAKFLLNASKLKYDAFITNAFTFNVVDYDNDKNIYSLYPFLNKKG